MNKRHMKGAVDPITLAFVLAILGATASMTLDDEDKSSQNHAETTEDIAENVALNRNE